MENSKKREQSPSTQSTNPVFDIIIDPNGYEGNMAVDEIHTQYLFYFNGLPISRSLTAGTHFLNTGASIGGTIGPNTSYIYFDVNSKGEITNLAQPDAASIGPDKKTIILKTVSLVVDVADYTGKYYLSAKSRIALSGNFTIKLVRFQLYTFDSGITYPDLTIRSYFNFFVDAAGNVTPDNNVHATPEQGRLMLKTTTAYIDPVELANGAKIQLPDGTVISNGQTITFAKGLLTWARWQNPSLNYFYFTPI